MISAILPVAEKQVATRDQFVARKNAVEQKLHAIQAVPAQEDDVRKQHDTLQVSCRFHNDLGFQLQQTRFAPAVRAREIQNKLKTIFV